MKKAKLIAIFILISQIVNAQVSFSGCYISGALIDPGSVAGCGNTPAYCNLASLYVPAFTPSACGTVVNGGGVSHSKLTVYTLPAGCSATVEAEFRKRNYLGVGSSASGCSNSGMDGTPDGFRIVQSGGVVTAQGSTINVNVGTCGAYPALGTYTTAVATISPGCSNADGYVRMELTGGTFSIQGTSNRADEIITFTLNISGTCGPGCVNVLPVEMTAFYAVANENDVTIHWHVASEVNIKEYILERSIDAMNWIKMGVVNTNQTFKSNIFYNLQDEFPFRGQNYYRLKSYDYEGVSEDHGITSVNFTNKTYNINVDQNENELIITCHPVLSGRTLNLLDVSGRLIKKVKISENHEAVISKSELPKGFHLLSCEDLPQTGTVKVLVY